MFYLKKCDMGQSGLSRRFAAKNNEGWSIFVYFYLFLSFKIMKRDSFDFGLFKKNSLNLVAAFQCNGGYKWLRLTV